MKVILSVLSLLYIVLGVLALALSITTIGYSIIKGFEWLSIIVMLPLLMFSFASLMCSIQYLGHRNRGAAESLATLTGFAVWMIAIPYGPDPRVFTAFDSADPMEAMLDVVVHLGPLLPILLGVATTKLLKRVIDRQYSQPLVNEPRPLAQQA